MTVGLTRRCFLIKVMCRQAGWWWPGGKTPVLVPSNHTVKEGEGEGSANASGSGGRVTEHDHWGEIG